MLAGRPEMVELVPYRDGVYSSFPTVVTHRGKVYVYYRQGVRSVYQVHGLFGKVKMLVVEEGDFLRVLAGELSAKDVASERVVFAEENELDAIVSQLEDGLFSLCTRVCVSGKVNQCFVSFNNEPEFREREPVEVDGVLLNAFYGKAFKSPYGYVFPAYGLLKGDGKQRPLLLVTDLERWELLSALPTMLNGNRLNECSVVFYNGLWHIFMREDDPPYGIWHSVSENLLEWDTPTKILSKAHAPMAFVVDEELVVGFRYLLRDSHFAVACMYPFEGSRIQIVDTYVGNMFDGGYCDFCVVGEDLFIVYYHDNGSGSPVIRCAKVVERPQAVRVSCPG